MELRNQAGKKVCLGGGGSNLFNREENAIYPMVNRQHKIKAEQMIPKVSIVSCLTPTHKVYIYFFKDRLFVGIFQIQLSPAYKDRPPPKKKTTHTQKC